MSAQIQSLALRQQSGGATGVMPHSLVTVLQGVPGKGAALWGILQDQ